MAKAKQSNRRPVYAKVYNKILKRKWRHLTDKPTKTREWRHACGENNGSEAAEASWVWCERMTTCEVRYMQVVTEL